MPTFTFICALDEMFLFIYDGLLFISPYIYRKPSCARGVRTLKWNGIHDFAPCRARKWTFRVCSMQLKTLICFTSRHVCRSSSSDVTTKLVKDYESLQQRHPLFQRLLFTCAAWGGRMLMRSFFSRHIPWQRSCGAVVLCVLLHFVPSPN